MKSMTGYGAAEGKVGHGRVFVEIRSVNHRYCDLNLKIPPKFNVLEHQMRKLVQAAVSRGKVELFLKERVDIAPEPKVVVNMQRAKVLQRCLRTLERDLKQPRRALLDVIDLRELICSEEQPIQYGNRWPDIAPICRRALQHYEQMRRLEGTHLLRDQRKRLGYLRKLISQIQRQALRNQQQLQREVQRDLQRLQTEGRNGGEQLGSSIDRTDITEEVVRLESHFSQYHRLLAIKDPVGRQLDFLLQEMNREVNTIASKAGDAAISQRVVEAKSELEKLREQAQNIE